MTNGKTVLESVIPAVSKSNGNYYGKDGLLYCGKCHTPKEAFFAKGIALMGKNKYPIECSCQRIERTKQEALINQQKHNDLVRRLKAEGFSDPAMLNWTFEKVDSKLQKIMVELFHNLDDAAARYGMPGNYVAGANIAGFERGVTAMNAQGIV